MSAAQLRPSEALRGRTLLLTGGTGFLGRVEPWYGAWAALLLVGQALHASLPQVEVWAAVALGAFYFVDALRAAGALRDAARPASSAAHP